LSENKKGRIVVNILFHIDLFQFQLSVINHQSYNKSALQNMQFLSQLYTKLASIIMQVDLSYAVLSFSCFVSLIAWRNKTLKTTTKI